ncbi:hypothetical protein [Pseudomonas putida]|uniref:hypothetical protein n=1 Tax=Pseudomonas putida TaxID=303 RepID=UPI0008592E52|nr:hypothetical protein [Pseudomonas putida]
MNEMMREQFEAWHLDRYCGGAERLKRCVNADDVYYYSDTQTRWVSWMASREAMVVKLPKSRSDKGETANGDQSLLSALMANHMAIERCKESIVAQGLKVSS